MALPFGDNVFTKFFTPKEYQVELLEAAKNENIIVCIKNAATRAFISLKLLQELSIVHRKDEERNCALFVVESSQQVTHYASAVQYLTDLRLNDVTPHVLPFNESVISAMDSAQVILATSVQAWELISKKFISLNRIYLLIVDDCHFAISVNHHLNKLMTSLRPDPKMRIFGMMFPLYTISNTSPGRIEANLDELQNLMHCRVETASDIVSILRYNCKPNEYLIECDVRTQDKLDRFILSEIDTTVKFLKEHRYDPSEIYDGELLEELKAVGDPTEEPLNIIYDFVYVLNTMGTWCANKAALASLFIVEKLKLKTPYERHFLLLCVVSSLMLKIRTIFDEYFAQFPDKDQLSQFISPKVQKLIEIFRCYKPTKRFDQETVENGEVVDENSKESVEESAESEPAGETKTTSPFTICDSYIRYKNDKANRNKNKKKHQIKSIHSRHRSNYDDSEIVCSIIFVKNRLIATVLHYLLADLKKFDNDDFWWLSPQFTIEKTADVEKEPRDAEIQHRNLEDVLRKFRTKDCNILIGTSMLEEGIDLPKCNLVVRFDLPHNFCSYVYSKSKACSNNANFFIMYEVSQKNEFIADLSSYYEIQRLLLKRCAKRMENTKDLEEANEYTQSVAPYVPVVDDEITAYVNLENAIACVNRYCAKLPSDSFTRLTPLWTTRPVVHDGSQCFTTSIRLPINSPYKKEIIGHPMPTEVLSRRIAALEACRVLHLAGELDDKLLPIGKESFHLLLLSDELVLDEADQLQASNEDDPRPGTNKRRQYYRRRIAQCFTKCRPWARTPLYLYSIKMVLSCPLPEEQNTRGRKIHAPEESSCGFGILLTKKIPKICAFPIFIRCGEVMVSLELVDDKLFLRDDQLERMSSFLNYTFTKVLRLHKYFMTFDSTNALSSYFIVPTITDSSGNVKIDWDFVDRIDQREGEELKVITDMERANFVFHKNLYNDTVVMPWYRNRDFPQHFYVAEICWNLSPRSEFPGIEYKTFEEYYFRKYQLRVQNLDQPLLDVDHTSMRLNFLTPRYVNRKGVALPTCSEATKKAKRESLAQKQILVPELCQIHTYPASLWRKAVALPCIMYRLNCLLLAEEIRNQVSHEIDLGLNTVPEDFEWEPLNFGWTLADVVRRTNELKQLKALKEDAKGDETDDDCERNEDKGLSQEEILRDSKNKYDYAELAEDLSDGEPFMEIGTWSNDMASDLQEFSDNFKNNVSSYGDVVRYGSPTNWMNADDNDLDMESIADSESSSESCFQNPSNLRIEFRNEFLAEAIDHVEECCYVENANSENEWLWESSVIDINVQKEVEQFECAVQKNKEQILKSDKVVTSSKPLYLKPFEQNVVTSTTPTKEKTLPWNLSSVTGYGMLTPSKLPTAYTVDELLPTFRRCDLNSEQSDEETNEEEQENSFSFDFQPDLINHVGPSPSVLLQALTMSNANDGVNLERLETIGDSFLKYAITNYLYSAHDNVHEGKLSHIRSKQVSNLHLYKLGNRKMFGECMVASKFEPHDNWLPPCFRIPCELEEALIANKASSCFWKVEDLPLLWDVTVDDLTFEKKTKLDETGSVTEKSDENFPYLPFHLITYHNIPDKSIADCVEALIGAYLISCGIRGALLFMSWLGIKVLPVLDENVEQTKVRYGYLQLPPSPLIRHVENPENELQQLMVGYEEFERVLRYRFNDPSYLLQAMTHASYSPNRVTDCYQRLEFLGDAVLDYLITRHLYEDKRQHSPGALTDLRSALVNNTIFAALAVRFGFHKYFRHLSPGLADVIHRFVRIQEDNDHTIFEEYYLINEEECEEVEDVEVPKALGDIFESVAGAIFLDSGMSLDAVWKVYYRIMKNEIEQFSTNVPKSPIRELLEMEPETAKFGRPEKLADGKRVRVTVEVFGKGTFKGIGRNYRIAKCTAAKCALKQLKKHGLVSKKRADLGVTN